MYIYIYVCYSRIPSGTGSEEIASYSGTPLGTWHDAMGVDDSDPAGVDDSDAAGTLLTILTFSGTVIAALNQMGSTQTGGAPGCLMQT